VGGEEGSQAGSEGAAPLRTGRILRVEDDLSLGEIIGDFLTAQGYTVVRAQSGVQGIREVLAGTFTAIVCDMMMPELPGDMFYRAVERACPQFCKRFIFITGHQGDGKVDAFLASVTGLTLRKPFRMEALLDAISVAEVRGTFRSVFESGFAEPGRFRSQAPDGSGPKGAAPRPRPAAVAQASTPVPAPPSPAVAEAAKAPPEEPKKRRGEPSQPARKKPWTSFGLRHVAVLVVAFAVISMGRYLPLRARAAAAEEALRSVEERCALAAAQLQKAQSKRALAEGTVKRARQIEERYRAPGWTRPLESTARTAASLAELRDLEARVEPAGPTHLRLRITGFATGSEPRNMAERFRQILDGNLKVRFAEKGVTTRLERLEEVSPATSNPADPQKRQAAFTIVAGAGGTAK
jgi:CheY-like chemotaxis protein